MSWREISAVELNNLKRACVIDVRSPAEHKSGCIPDSQNVPLLSDDERALVGTTYARDGEMVARRQALDMVAGKIPALVDDVLKLRRSGHALVVYCWRGGLRSEAVASVLSIAGVDCWRLTGGYKSWRGRVLQDFKENSWQFPAVVVHGQTGVGKTEILQMLAATGFQVLDLEALANHRGSVFGGMGLGAQPSQKDFEAALWQQLRTLSDGPVFLEAESRKIGQRSLPDCIFERIQSGVSVLVTGSLEARCQRISEEYLRAGGALPDKVAEQLVLLDALKERLGTQTVSRLRELVVSGDVGEAVRILLVDYYDPLYSRQIERARPFALEVSGDDPTAAAAALGRWCGERFSWTSQDAGGRDQASWQRLNR
jgi:tRNA 2-selenouridine synthase